MPTRISAADLRALIEDETTQIAFLDLRSPLRRDKDGHIAATSNIPYQELEPRIGRAVPHRDTPIVLASEPELDARGAQILQRLGYRDVRVLDGGIAAWRRAGGRVYTGTNVRSKTLGEWIERRFGTPTVDATTVRKWQESGEDVVIVDSRTLAEYRHHHIPGGLYTGGGVEAVYRISAAVRSPSTRVVVNCQGRTRGIVGAQSLIDLGLDNPVYSLRNGTPAWQEAGYELAKGEGEHLPAPAQAPAAGRAWAERTLRELAVPSLGSAELNALLGEASVTVYLLDVRSAEEYAAGHLPGSVSVPGGVLLQNTDDHLVVRGAHVVLIDGPDRIRAAGTARWLRYLHDGPISVTTPDTEITAVPAPPLPAADAEQIPWARFAADRGAHRVYDLRSSAAYLAGHIVGSVHARRETLDRLAAETPDGTFLLVGDATFDPSHIAADLSGRGVRAAVLHGGVEAVAEPLTTADPVLAAGVQDQVGPPDFGPERDAWYREYFAWELSLLEQTAGDPLFDFEGIFRRWTS